MSPHDCKRLVAAFSQFLEDELKRDGVTHDMIESIDVARQCLLMAYATSSEDVPSTQKKLLDIFVEACPPPVSMNYGSQNRKKSIWSEAILLSTCLHNIYHKFLLLLMGVILASQQGTNR